MKRCGGILILLAFLLTSCQLAPSRNSTLPRVLAVESFLADIARNVIGDRLVVESLLPVDADPHAYQPSPRDAAKIADADVIILNGANLEAFLAPILQSLDKQKLVISASAGLTPLPDPSRQHPEGDPHFWLDPNNVITYVDNIRDELTKVDPEGSTVYAANAEKYSNDLHLLDNWIKSQIRYVPPSRRLLVTNHETWGYFAERYGFTIVGAIIPSITSGAAPSAQKLATLVELVRSTGTPAIFLEAGTNPQLANQIAAETGVKVVTDLYTHSLSLPGGQAETYIDLMKYDVTAIVEALK